MARVKHAGIGARSGRLRQVGGLELACIAGVLLVAATQLAGMGALLDVRQDLTAGFAKGLVLAYALAMIAVAAATGLLRAERLTIPLWCCAALALPVLATTLVVDGRGWSLLVALLTMTTCWWVGRGALLALRSPDLARDPPVAWLAGLTIVTLVLLFAGRAGLLRWWTAGIAVLGIGAWGGLVALRGLRGELSADRWRRLRSDRLAVAALCIATLTLGLAAVWAAAPEIMYDAVYAKAWLPREWARTGEIAPLFTHPALTVQIGTGQVLAVPGWLLGAPSIGRYLQWLAVGGIFVSVWWGARRSPWAPVAAVVVLITPQVFWQATTAYDDALVTLAAVSLAIAVVRLGATRQAGPGWSGASLGLLVGGLVDLKIHTAPFAAGVVLVWILSTGSGRMRAVAGLAATALVTTLAPLILHWIDMGNPVLPAYNDVFHSPYWPFVNERLNFETLAPAGPLGPLSLLWTATTHTVALANHSYPTGALGLLVPASVAAVLVLWRGARRHPAMLAIWVGLLLGLTSWYLQFRNVRYVLPTGTVAVLALAIVAPRRPPGAWSVRVVLGAIAAIAVLLWPSTVAQFWNVPGRDIPWRAAVGQVDLAAYERVAAPERDGLAVFDRLAPPGAMVLTGAHQRLWLSGGRDLTPAWELIRRTRIVDHPAASPEQLERILRAAGVGWVLTDNGGNERRIDQIGPVLATDADAVWGDRAWTLYRLGTPPAPDQSLQGRCAARPVRQPGCWQGTLDARPGYRGQESPRGIVRSVAVCAGSTLTADLVVAGAGLVTVGVDFNGPDPIRGHQFWQLGAGPGRVAATAPPGATRARVTVLAPPGDTVERARLGRRDRCSPPSAGTG
jgi:hypothetical protein